MRKRLLGTTGIEISELGYGATAQFGKDFLRKPCISYNQALYLVQTALESGITFFDTGFNYGYAEERLGQCLSDIFEQGIYKREDIVISTKGGEKLRDDGTYGEKDYSPEWIRRTVELSIQRLKTTYIDMFALHSAKPEDVSDKLLYLIEDLKQNGMIKAFGISGITDDMGEWLCSNKLFDYVMMSYNYAEARRNSLIERLYENNIGIISGGSLNRSLSTINYIPRSLNDVWYIARTIRHFREDLCRQKTKFDFVNNVEGMTPQQVSLAYILRNKRIASACFNTVNVEHLRENVSVQNKTLPQNIIDRIEKERYK